MSFHPSPSVDCRTTPMEVVLPFIEENMAAAIQNKQNQLQQNIEDKMTPRSESPVGTLCCQYQKSSGQCVCRCPPRQITDCVLSGKLLCITQIGTLAFYQALLGEFVGTMLLTLICTSTGLPITSTPVSELHGALVAGLAVATIIVAFGHISGAHVNPAITVSFLVAREIDAVRAFCYVVVQLLGAIAGSCLLKAIVPPNIKGALGLNKITKGVTIPQAILVEAIITFMLCYTVRAICDKKREDVAGSKALTVGLAITVGCLFGGPYTSASMNPARSFGPANVFDNWENHWVYWVGPMSGAVAAAILYQYILRTRIPVIVRSDSLQRPRDRNRSHI